MKKITPAKFIISSPKLSLCPDFGNLPEFALLGRSNVGKSSFINRLANNGKLAKTSNKPGKTRLINFFDFNGQFIIADMPGYGFANVKKEMKDQWERDLAHYLENRASLTSCIQFIDARHPVQANDYQMREWLAFKNLPVITIATKVDCLKRSQIAPALAALKKELDCEVLPFSAKDNAYTENVVKFLLSYGQTMPEDASDEIG